jgi:hypothetical protein
VSELPADPFRSGEDAADALREGATVLGALDGLADEEGGRNLVRGLLALPREDLRSALLAAVVERHVARRPRLGLWTRAVRRLGRGENRALG